MVSMLTFFSSNLSLNAAEAEADRFYLVKEAEDGPLKYKNYYHLKCPLSIVVDVVDRHTHSETSKVHSSNFLGSVKTTPKVQTSARLKTCSKLNIKLGFLC